MKPMPQREVEDIGKQWLVFVHWMELDLGRQIGPLHDVIGPYQPNARVAEVYPVIVDAIETASA